VAGSCPPELDTEMLDLDAEAEADAPPPAFLELFIARPLLFSLPFPLLTSSCADVAAVVDDVFNVFAPWAWPCCWCCCWCCCKCGWEGIDMLPVVRVDEVDTSLSFSTLPVLFVVTACDVDLLLNIAFAVEEDDEVLLLANIVPGVETVEEVDPRPTGR